MTGRFRRTAAAVLLLALLTGVRPAVLPAQAPTASAPAVTAAFLLNFIKFIEWRPDVLAPGAPLVMCAGDPAVTEALERAVPRRPAASRPIVVTPLGSGAVSPACRVLFTGELTPARTDGLVAAVAGRSVLTVGMGEDFTRRGGVIHLFIQDGNMRFGVNPRAAERAGLRVSSHLLKLAQIVSE